MPETTSTNEQPRIVVLGALGAGKSALISAVGEKDATLIEGAGEEAQELFAGRQTLEASGVLAGEVKNADAVIVTIPPTESRQLEQTFRQLVDFLKRFEEQRGRRNDIAGLPVYVVLTKSDLLARQDDTARSWMGRIEEGKRAAGQRLEEFLEQPGDAPFGEIDLHLGATALRQPPLVDHPAPSERTFGVTELFQGVLTSARAFHAARSRSQSKLHGAVLGALGLIAVLAAVSAGFVAARPSAEVAALENAVNAALPEAPAAQRLREPLEQRQKELAKIASDPAFGQLPTTLQEEVRAATRELNAYQELSKQFDALKRVRFFKKEEEIPKYSEELAKISLPPAYASAWAETALAKKIRQYESQLAALSGALVAEKDWLKNRIEEGEKLRRMAIPAENSPERQAWIAQADAFLKRKDLSKAVAGVPNMKLRELYEFPTVKALREGYEIVRDRVDKIRGGLAAF